MNAITSYVITSFRGEYEWLNNAFPCNVRLDNELYSSVEHAFQAAKTSDAAVRAQIWACDTPAEAKELGRKVQLDPDWDQRRVDVMTSLILTKFSDNVGLKVQLLLTGDAELIQGEMRRDQFWGVDKNGVGENQLGKILMSVRDNLRAQEGSAGKVLRTFLNANGLQVMAAKLESVVTEMNALFDNQLCTSSDHADLEKLIQDLE